MAGRFLIRQCRWRGNTHWSLRWPELQPVENAVEVPAAGEGGCASNHLELEVVIA